MTITHPTDRMTVVRVGDREFRIAQPTTGPRFSDDEVRDAVRERLR